MTTVARDFSLAVLLTLAAASCGANEARPVAHADPPPVASASSSSASIVATSPATSASDGASTPPPRVVELPGVDTSAMIPSEKAYFTEIVTQAPSPCGDAATLDVCVLEHRPCKACRFAAEAAARLVVQGEYAADVRKWIALRFDATAPRTIALGDAPTLGRKEAPITIVEFADFECPHCGKIAPRVHDLVSTPAGALSGKLRLVFKHMPLAMHPRAEPAARAAWAAARQGKFWPMHDRLFAHQDTLEDADLAAMAKASGCEPKKWDADWRSDVARAQVAADYALGEQVGVVGTPSLFIDGRKFVPLGSDDYDLQLRRWLEIELALLGP